MQEPSISSSGIAKIETIEFIDEEFDLIDIEVEGEHTFWVSDDDRHWILTHNSGAPDIDSDLADRDKVLDQLRDYFGYRNVVPISNMNCFKVKSLLSDLSKFYGIPFDEVKVATRTVEQDVRRATTKHGDDKNLFVLKYDDALKHSKSFKAFIDQHPEVGESMNVLFKQNKSLGRHAGGVLICDDLPNKIPLITNRGEPQAPWVEGVNFKSLEKVGNFIKYDALGLETLRLIERAIELIIAHERTSRGFKELTLDDGTVRRLYGDELVKTLNRGEVMARDLTPEDDIE
jgi:DNA polymerase III alpha subunit